MSGSVPGREEEGEQRNQTESGCCSDTPDSRPWGFRAGTIFLLGLIQTMADGPWEGLAGYPGLFVLCCRAGGLCRAGWFQPGQGLAAAGVCCTRGEK